MNVPFGTPDPGAIQGLLRDAHAAVASGDPTKALRLVLTALHATGGQAAAAPAINRVLEHLTANNQTNALQELTELFARAASVSSGPPPPQPSSAPYGDPSLRDAITAANSDSMSCGSPSASASASMGLEARGPAGPPLGEPYDGGGGGGGGGGAAALAARSGGGTGWGPDGGWWRGDGQEATSSWTGPSSVGPQPHAPILSETGREGFMDCALQDGSSYVCPRCGGVVMWTRMQQHEQFWCQRGGMGSSDSGEAEG